MIGFDAGQVMAAVRESKRFAAASRFWTGRLFLKMGDEAYRLTVVDGKPTAFERDDALLTDRITLGKADIAISGPAPSWQKLLQKIPPPGFQNPLFVAGGAGFEVEGDGVTAIGPFFWPVQQFLDVLRDLRNGTPPAPVIPETERTFDDAVGRYMYVDIQGVQYRIYYEEAGQGAIPLILQHTAGADSRQWRHVLEDPDYQKHYRIISYDLPFHGRSLPPTSEPWWEKPYRLTRDFLMEAVVAISRKLELDRPVFMGCSVGGMLAPDLAYYHPDKFRAVIALNGALGMDPSQRAMVEKGLAIWSNPRISNQWTMALIHANLAPTSPTMYARETIWIYSQGAPGLNEGDLYYYAIDHDLTAEQASTIDTSKVGVYLITGEYDGLALDGGSQRLADAIEGSRLIIAPGLGHFGPSEHPEATKDVLLPVLQEIATKSREPAIA